MSTKKADPANDIRALEELRHEMGPAAPRPPAWTTEIQKRYFPPRRGAYNAFVSNPLEVRRLPKAERRILELLCAADCGESWGNSGMPPDIRSRRRLLRLDPPSLMEDLVPCPALGKGKFPRWRVLKLALDKYGSTYIGKKPGPPTQEWLTAKWFDLSPAQWLELWTEVKARSYGIVTAWGDPFDGAIAAVSKEERRAWASRWCDEIRRSPERALQSWVGRSIVRSFEGSGEKVPPAVTAMMKLTPPAVPAPNTEPEPRVGRDQYVFFGRKGFDVESIETLDRVSKAQFLVATGKFGGRAFKTPKAFFSWEAKEEETTIDGVGVARWKIAKATDKKRALYEMWTFLVERHGLRGWHRGAGRDRDVPGTLRGRRRPRPRREAGQEPRARDARARPPGEPATRVRLNHRRGAAPSV